MSGIVLDDEVAGYEKYPDLPTQNQSVTAGRYKIKESNEAFVEAEGPEIASKVWFRSPVSDHLTTEICIQITNGDSL
jgi:hypothetical protein